MHLPVQHFRGFPEVRANESNLKLFSTAILKPCKGTPMHSTILKQTCDIVLDASAWGRDLRPATQCLSYHLGPPATKCLYARPENRKLCVLRQYLLRAAAPPPPDTDTSGRPQ